MKSKKVPESILFTTLIHQILALYDDFINFYIELEDELIKGKLENENERQFLRFLYFAKRYIEVLDREEKLNVINNAGQRIATNARMNQKYLENAERRRLMNAEARQTAVQDPNDMYGIDFKKWEENLQAIERENKLIVKFGEQKKRKQEKAEKEEEKKKLKEDEIKEYNEYHERVTEWIFVLENNLLNHSLKKKRKKEKN